MAQPNEANLSKSLKVYSEWTCACSMHMINTSRRHGDSTSPESPYSVSPQEPFPLSPTSLGSPTLSTKTFCVCRWPPSLCPNMLARCRLHFAAFWKRFRTQIVCAFFEFANPRKCWLTHLTPKATVRFFPVRYKRTAVSILLSFSPFDKSWHIFTEFMFFLFFTPSQCYNGVSWSTT